ncbi:MAG: TadE family protein [Gemmataceae bacterium]
MDRLANPHQTTEWLLLFCGTTIVIVCSFYFSRWSGNTTTRENLVHGEAGVSYSMGFVMALPVFLAITLVWFEAGYLLLTKMATVQAAHMAARSASVWLPMARQPGTATGNRVDGEGQILWSAILPMTPFGLSKPGNKSRPGSNGVAMAGEAQRAYSLISSERAGSIARKYRDAGSRVSVNILEGRKPRAFEEDSTDSSVLDGQIRLEVVYKAPQIIPWFANVIQKSSKGRGYYTIKTEARIPGEYPRNTQRKFSIPYDALLN